MGEEVLVEESYYDLAAILALDSHVHAAFDADTPKREKMLENTFVFPVRYWAFSP